MNRLIFSLLFLGLLISSALSARHGLDMRQGAKCYHNDDLYLTLRRYQGEVCPPPPMYFDNQGNHVAADGVSNKHTPEDCVIYVVPPEGK